MKTRILFTATVLVFSFNDTFAWYSRTTMNGGPNGYYCTSKEVDSAGNTTITCEDPGNSSCPLRPSNPNHDHLIDVAVNAIKNNELTGTYTDDSGTIRWTATNKNMSSSVITID